MSNWLTELHDANSTIDDIAFDIFDLSKSLRRVGMIGAADELKIACDRLNKVIKQVSDAAGSAGSFILSKSDKG